MSMLLGAPVWYGNRPFKETIEALSKLGLEYFEFSLDYPLPGSMRAAEQRELARLLEEFDLKIGFHSPLDTPVTHPRDELAAASLHVLRQCMAFAAAFQPRSIYYNFHIHPRVPTFKLADVHEEIHQKGLARCDAITRTAAEFGLPPTVENDLVPFDRAQLLLDALTRYYPQLHFTFDIGHAIKAEECHARSRCARGDLLEHLRPWVERCGAKVLVAHLHDYARSGNRDHLSLGKGEVDLSAVLELLHQSTSCQYLLLETFWKDRERAEMDYEELRRNVEWCKSYW
jgi:sugar phosphate isomerase/epimerase